MKKYLGILGMALGFCLSAIPAKAYTIWADNFESGSMRSGWTMYKQIFSGTTTTVASNAQDIAGGYVDGYYPRSLFGPYAVESGQGGLLQGSHQAKIYPDYWNGDGGWDGGKLVTISLLRSHIITADDIANLTNGVFQMDLDYKFESAPGANSGAFAFAKLGPNWWVDREAFSLNGGNWGSASVSMGLNSGHIGAEIQFGVTTYARNYEPSAVFIDNVTVSNIPEPSSAALMGFGVAGLLISRLRRKV